jgi:hypothetical protein
MREGERSEAADGVIALVQRHVESDALRECAAEGRREANVWKSRRMVRTRVLSGWQDAKKI